MSNNDDEVVENSTNIISAEEYCEKYVPSDYLMNISDCHSISCSTIKDTGEVKMETKQIKELLLGVVEMLDNVKTIKELGTAKLMINSIVIKQLNIFCEDVVKTIGKDD